MMAMKPDKPPAMKPVEIDRKEDINAGQQEAKGDSSK